VGRRAGHGADAGADVARVDGADVCAALGVEGDVDVVSSASPKVMVAVPDEASLDALAPDHEALWEACAALDATGVYVFTRHARDADVAARQFPVRRRRERTRGPPRSARRGRLARFRDRPGPCDGAPVAPVRGRARGGRHRHGDAREWDGRSSRAFRRGVNGEQTVGPGVKSRATAPRRNAARRDLTPGGRPAFGLTKVGSADPARGSGRSRVWAVGSRRQ
jgi:hypothetical protein